MSLSGAAKLAGVTGWPVSQSLSPRLHGFWLEEYGIDGAYVPLPIRPEDFAAAVDGLCKTGFAGINVTLPHKQAAFALAVRHDAAAKFTGAVNLLLFGKNGVEGRNSDVYGLTATLRDALGMDCVKGKTVAVWGAGGAARGALYALSEMGAADIRIFNRTAEKAAALAKAFAPFSPARLSGAAYDLWTEGGKDCALIVHTTSAGMKEAPSLNLPLEVLPAGAAVFDAVYNPLETGLLTRAKGLGFKTIDGLWMLIHQAVPSFKAFYGIEPHVTPALRRHLEKALFGG
jgi:shikimate dehydrogenase